MAEAFKMKEVLHKLETRTRDVARHPFYSWLESDHVPLGEKFVFAPVFVNFIMIFSDLNKWFMRYESPGSDHERAINRHTCEDETHSRLFLEDWKKLGFDRALGWSSGETIRWYYAAGETEIFRRYGMEIMRMCVLHDDPLVRFALMSAIEACGHVFFTVTSHVATALSAETGKEYRYFGPYHLKRETGHVLNGNHPFHGVTLDGRRREQSFALIDRIFDMFLVENDHVLSYAEAMLRNGREPHATRAKAAREPTRPPSRTPDPRGRESPRGTRAHAEVERVLGERMKTAARHDLFRWMQEETLSAETKLKRFVALWTPDVMGYKDLARYALAYSDPADPRERAINRWGALLESHHELFLHDWAELGMDELFGWMASHTLQFYCLSEHTEMPRRNMASFVRLAYAHPDPVLRFWLMTALESSGEAFFQNTRMLAEQVEKETGKRLDYLGDRHSLSHPVLEPDEEADRVEFRSEALTAEGRDIAIGMVETVFDAITEQYSLSLDLATRNVFMVR
jgi:hypothetical protein